MIRCSHSQDELRRWTLFSFALAVAAAIPQLARAESSEQPQPLTFERHIRPILKAHCFHCHGGEGETSGGLDLRLQRFMVGGGDSGAAVLPGDAVNSYLYERVASGEMPPKGEPLTAEQVKTIADWINQGAPTARPEPETLEAGVRIIPEDREYWAFQPVRRPAMPSVEHTAQIRTPVDAFLLARLEPAGRTLSETADRLTL